MRIVTLCGSSKFKKQFREVEAVLALQGNIVLSLNFFEHADGIEISPEQAAVLAEVHRYKLNMCDEVFVIDVDGYIGESTREEIEFAKRNRKNIKYYSQKPFPKYLGEQFITNDDDVVSSEK